MIYLDNAATSFRKPESVYAAVDHALRRCSGNPGRSGHKVSMLANEIVRKTRLLCASFFNAESSEQIIFCSNATDALNLAIKGMLGPGDHAVTTSMEHNSVARPLEAMKKNGVDITKVESSPSMGLTGEHQEKFKEEHETCSSDAHIERHGHVNDITEIGRICRERGTAFP
jgi:selenocysteine lyase/cysteine desulfurase